MRFVNRLQKNCLIAKEHQDEIFNKTGTEYPIDKSVSQLFENIVKNYPDHIAVATTNEKITYEELNNKANILASFLRQEGIGVNTLVGLYLDRSINFIICLLAIIKAGGCYLPLDVNEPGIRTRKILEDSKPLKILCDETSKQTLEQMLDLKVPLQNKVIDINEFFRKSSIQNAQNLENINISTDLMYVMYTSGSTGNPKGCMIPQKGVIRLVKNTSYIKITSSDIIAQASNPAFDALTFEVWGALLNGASLCIIPRNELLSPLDFSRVLQEYRISILFITTALFNLIVKTQIEAFDRLRYLLTGGEKANTEIMNMLFERKRRNKLINLNIVHVYGPTESTTFALSFCIQHQKQIHQHIPIGKPISNTKAYILNDHLECVDPGLMGELYLAGDGLAMGYLNDPVKTAEKFIVCPWNRKKKLYKTGDLVFWSEDQGIIFVERNDKQVKLHGFRVELGEVEACCLKHSAIKQAVVLLEDEPKFGKHLVAYLSVQQNMDINSATLLEFIKEQLPYYMVPKKLMLLDFIPFTDNGKIDKTRLSMMQGDKISEFPHQAKPTNNIIEILLEVWSELLGMNNVDIYQNIFDLGAHSLMLGQALILLNAKFKHLKKISILDIFTYPSIHAFANFISMNEDKHSESSQDLAKSIHRANFKRRLLSSNKRHHATQY